MPELPEVETMVRDLAPRVTGRAIVDIQAAFPGSVIHPAYPAFEVRLRQRQITGVSRRGKYAIFALDSEDVLVVHRGMTGSLFLRPSEAPIESHLRMMFHLDDGLQIRFHDPRKFGKVYLMAANGEERPLPWSRMGPEPLESSFTHRSLGTSLLGRKALLKPLLLNQSLIAGLGNIYVDEALYLSRIHPERRAHTLTGPEIKRLHTAIVDVLTAAIEQRGTTFSSYRDVEGLPGAHQFSLQVFHRTGSPCLRCGTAIVKLTVGSRGTHICPRCQKP